MENMSSVLVAETVNLLELWHDFRMISDIGWNDLQNPGLFFKIVETVFSNILISHERIE